MHLRSAVPAIPFESILSLCEFVPHTRKDDSVLHPLTLLGSKESDSPLSSLQNLTADTLRAGCFFGLCTSMKIAIIGGGIAGLMLAYKSAKAGYHTELFEAEGLASGASSKALGVLVPVTGMNRPIDQMQRAGIASWPVLAAELSQTTSTPLASLWRDWGNGRQQVNLSILFKILEQAIIKYNGIIHTQTPVAPNNLPHGFTHTILAAGFENKTLAQAPLTISAGLAARFTGELDHLITANNLFLCPSFEEGEILAGSINWHLATPGDGTIPPEKLDELTQRVQALAPNLQLKEAWVGYRPTQAPRLPLMRHLGNNVHAVTGLGKIGIGLSPMLELPI